MKVCKWIFIIFILFGQTLLSQEVGSPIHRIGILAGGSPQAVKMESEAFSRTLEERLHVPIQMQVSKSYEDIIKSLKNKEIDFAFLTPHTFVSAEGEVALKVLLKRVWDGPFYYSAIIARQKSKIKTLKDLKGKTTKKKIIFVDELSTSGYLYPLVLLKKEGVLKSDLEILFSKNHESSIRMLSSGQAEVAAVFADDERGQAGAWTKYPIQGLKVRVLSVSEPIPNDPFCVRSEFFEKYPHETYRLMSELIDLNQDREMQKKFTNILGSKSLSPATSRQYDPVREMMKELGR